MRTPTLHTMEVTSTVIFQLYVATVLMLTSCSAAPTAIALTAQASATSQSVADSYRLLIQETEALNNHLQDTVNLFKNERFGQSDVVAPNMDITGFLTVADLPSMVERRSMTEVQLMPKHKQFLQTYAVVMNKMIWEENNAYSLDPSSYSSSFEYSYRSLNVSINRVLHKVSELMTEQNISDGDAATFTGFMWVPPNPQIHNTRSLYVLQKIAEYLPASIMDYIALMEKSQ